MNAIIKSSAIRVDDKRSSKNSAFSRRSIGRSRGDGSGGDDDDDDGGGGGAEGGGNCFDPT